MPEFWAEFCFIGYDLAVDTTSWSYDRAKTTKLKKTFIASEQAAEISYCFDN